MLLFNSFFLIIFIVVLGATTYRYLIDIQKYEMPESPVLLLTTSLALKMASIIFGMVHLWIYSYNGRGIYVLEIIATM